VEFSWTDDQEAFRRDLRAFVDERVPAEWGVDHRRLSSEEATSFSRAFVRGLAERGWLAPHWPVEFGGHDDPWLHLVLGEELWARGEPRGPQYMNVNWIAPAILAAGTPDQREYHLGRIRNGDVIWCQGFSEPEAGSDLASLRTRAIRDGEDYIVNGQKIWTSYANEAEFCFLIARTDPHSEGGRGLTILLVEMNIPGIEVRRIDALAGEHAFHEVFFQDVRVPVDTRLGDEGGAWKLIRTALAYERVGLPRYASVGRELDRLGQAARDSGAIDDAGVAAAFGAAFSACEAARLLTYLVVGERVTGLPPSANAYVARVAMVRAERTVAELAAMLGGASSLREGAATDRLLNSAMLAGIAGGAYEIQLNLIARLSLGLPRSEAPR
jgi:alkylation response protein AidB-like acyl-CoA dehydrogenase